MESSGENYWTRLRGRSLSRRRFLVGTGAVAGSAAFLAACGGGNNAKSTNGPAATQASTAASAATTRAGTPAGAAGTQTGVAPSAAATRASSPATQAPAGVRGGTLRNFRVSVDGGMDPAVYHLNNYEVVNLGFNQTMTYQVSKNLFAMDGMAKFEQVDPLTWVWHVREGMQFHNGDPITAEDWAYSMNRIPVLQKERRGHTGVPLFNYIQFPVTAVDAKTVQMKLTRPNGSTPINLSRQYFAFVNKKVVEAQPPTEGFPTKDVQTVPLGAGGGPYILQKHDATGTTITRNPKYYKHEPPDDGFVVDGPYIDTIETKILGDRSAQIAAFLAGDLDVLGPVDSLEADQFKGKPNLVIKGAPNGLNSNFSFDSKKFVDPRGRQAIRAAIDYDAYIASVLGGDGIYQAPVNVILPAFQGLTQADIKKYYTYDPAKAKQLWEAAGKPVQNIRILSQSTSQSGLSIADFVKQSLVKVLGVSVEIQATDLSTWAQRANNNTGAKDWEILNTATNIAAGTSGVPEDSHLIWFDPRGGYASLTFNMSPDSDVPELKTEATKVAQMMGDQETETDAAKRKAKLVDLQRYMLDNAYVVLQMPIQSKAFLGFSSRLQDVPVDDWLNYYQLRRASMWIKA